MKYLPTSKVPDKSATLTLAHRLSQAAHPKLNPCQLPTKDEKTKHQSEPVPV